MKAFLRFTIFIVLAGLIYWAVQFYDVRVKVPEPIEFQSAKEVVEDIKGPGGAGIMQKAESSEENGGIPSIFEGSPDDIISLANEVRKEKNLPALEKNEKLMESAMLKAQDMKEGEYFEHVSPSGLDMSYFVSEVEYKYATVGENLAEGYFSSRAVHDAWMNSEGHRENIISPDFEEIGVAVLEINKDGFVSFLAVQHFGAEFTAEMLQAPAPVVCKEKDRKRCEDAEEQREDVKDVIEKQEKIIDDARDEGYSDKHLRDPLDNLEKLEDVKDELKDYLRECEEFMSRCDEWR